jgi:hypothetical protein
MPQVRRREGICTLPSMYIRSHPDMDGIASVLLLRDGSFAPFRLSSALPRAHIANLAASAKDARLDPSLDQSARVVPLRTTGSRR